jgi:hypothetical protein
MRSKTIIVAYLVIPLLGAGWAAVRGVEMLYALGLFFALQTVILSLETGWKSGDAREPTRRLLAKLAKPAWGLLLILLLPLAFLATLGEPSVHLGGVTMPKVSILLHPYAFGAAAASFAAACLAFCARRLWQAKQATHDRGATGVGAA